MTNIPKLFQTVQKKGVINPDFIDFNEFKNWSPERQIEVFWKLVKERVFGKYPDLSTEKIDKSMQAFNTAYGITKYKFQDIERNTGGRYFDHLVRVMEYLILNSKNPTLKKTIIALCHDLIEDTDFDFLTLKNIFGTYIAFGILLISKKPIRNFISLSEDYETLITIEISGILNSKGLISDEYLQRKTYFPETITQEEKDGEKLFSILQKAYKDERNKEYFSHMTSNGTFLEKISENTPCLNNFFERALLISKNTSLRIRLSKEEIKQICLDALEVKFWDRIDNLQTTEIYDDFTYENYKKAQRKIEETQKYFYKIALEFDIIMGTDFYSLILFEVEKLKSFILFKNQILVKVEIDGILQK